MGAVFFIHTVQPRGLRVGLGVGIIPFAAAAAVPVTGVVDRGTELDIAGGVRADFRPTGAGIDPDRRRSQREVGVSAFPVGRSAAVRDKAVCTDIIDRSRIFGVGRVCASPGEHGTTIPGSANLQERICVPVVTNNYSAIYFNE